MGGAPGAASVSATVRRWVDAVGGNVGTVGGNNEAVPATASMFAPARALASAPAPAAAVAATTTRFLLRRYNYSDGLTLAF